jgi:hypothetical protein
MPQKPPKPPHDDLSELEKRFEATTEALRRMTAETERSEELRRIDHEGILDPTINELRQNMRSLTLQVERQADATRAAQAENRGTAGAQELLRLQKSEAEILTRTKILKADIRVLDKHVFNHAVDHDTQLRLRGLTSLSDAQEYLDFEWQERTTELERRIMSPAMLDVSYLSRLVETKQNLIFLIVEHVLRQKRAIDTFLGREADAAAQLLGVGNSTAPLNDAHGTPSAETTSFLTLCKSIVDLFSLLRALPPGGGGDDIAQASTVIEKLQKAHDNTQKELKTLGALHSSLEREYNLLTVGGNNGGGGAQVILLKQRTQIDDLRTQLHRMKDDIASVRKENADLLRENGTLHDTIARINLTFGEEKRKDTMHLEKMAPRLRDLEVQATGQVAVLKQAIIDMDFMGALAKNYSSQITELQNTIESFSEDRAEQKRRVKFAQTSEQALAQKCEEKERIARVAITARREATEQYRRVKANNEAFWKQLEETQRDLDQEKALHHHDLEAERHRSAELLTEAEGREDALKMEIGQHLKEIQKLRGQLDANKHAMGEFPSMRSKIHESAAIIGELEVKNKELMEQIYELRVAGPGIMDLFSGAGGTGESDAVGENDESFGEEVIGAVDGTSLSSGSSRGMTPRVSLQNHL